MHKLKEFRANLGLLLMDVFTKDPTINRVIIERFLSGQSVGTIHAETNSMRLHEHTVKQIEAFQNKVYDFVASIPDIAQLEADAEARVYLKFGIQEWSDKLFGESIPFGKETAEMKQYLRLMQIILAL